MTDLTLNTEDETMQAFAKVAEFVNRARDAIINASTLAKEVGELRAAFETLKGEIDDAHKRNADFETQLAFVRSERDQALAQAEEFRHKYVDMLNAHDNLNAEHQSLQQRHEQLKTEHFDAKLERDDALMETRRVTDELEKLKADRDKVIFELEAIHKMLTPQPRAETGQFEPKPAVNW